MADYEREYNRAAFDALKDWPFLLPCDVQRKVKLAISLSASHGFPTVDELREQVGGRNWVLARRSARIIAKYGDDVICLTPKQYEAAERRAIEARFPGEVLP